MFEQFENLTIRNVTVEDADLLSVWWNDGKIMAHAGFPNGTGETAQCIAEKISKDEDNICRRLMIEYNKIPIGEMNYCNVGNDTAEIGIKICDFSKHNKGFRKVRVKNNSWRNQLGELQSSVDYELVEDNFNDFTKTIL